MRLLLTTLLLSGLTLGQQPMPRGKGTTERPWRDKSELRVPAGEQPSSGLAARYTGPSVIGKNYLQNRRYLKAVEVFRKQLADQPEAKGVQALLGHSLAGAGKCDEARSLMLPNRDARAFTVQGASALAGCFSGEADYAESVFWIEEALLFEPEQWSLWNQYAIFLFRLGDAEASVAALERAEELAPEEPGLYLSRAILALADGDVEAVNEMLWLYDQATFQPTVTRLQVEAQLEMDLGNPVLGERRLARALSIRPFFEPCIALRIEAIRRLSYPDSAMTLFELREGRLDVESSPEVRARLARLAVDLDDLPRARALIDADLEAHPLEPEVLASAWYLAQAEGRAADAEALAVRYDRVRPNPLRQLDELLPAETLGE